MGLNALTTEEVSKLEHVIKEAVGILTEVHDLKGGMRDTVHHVAKELDIPLRSLNKAITLAFKKSQSHSAVEDAKEQLDEAEEILHLAKII